MMQRTPFFRLVSITRGTRPAIHVEYSNGVKATYRTHDVVGVFDEQCRRLSDPLKIGMFYRANISRNRITDFQRCVDLFTGGYVWNCDIDQMTLTKKETNNAITRHTV